MNLSAFPALVLNADYRPLNIFPLSLKPAEEAIKNICEGTVTVVAEYDKIIRSPSIEMKLPSVVAMRNYVPIPHRVAFTRFNVLLRDRFHCQYCREKFPSADLTFDHVTPRSKGGATCWDNIVAACSPCNLRKADLTPAEAKMWPWRAPAEPSARDLMAAKRVFPPNYLHESWIDYLYWDVEIER